MQQSLDSLLSRRPSPEKPWNRIWAILLKQDDDRDSPGERERERGKERKKPLHIGNIGMPREAEIGYRIHPDYWGQGYMSEALGMFIGFWWAEEGEGLFSLPHPPIILSIDPPVRGTETGLTNTQPTSNTPSSSQPPTRRTGLAPGFCSSTAFSEPS